MSYSSLSFSATLPPFYYTSGYNTNFSNTNLSATGDLALSTTKDGVTGQDYTTVSSALISNGVSYAENSAALNGNLLTVNYTSTNAISGGTAGDLLNTFINGTGVNFSAENSTTNGSSVTTGYGTSANNNFGLSIPHSAISTGSSDSGQKIVLKSLSVVGSTITAVYELKDTLSNNVTLAPHEAPVTTTTEITTQTPIDNGKGPTFSANGFNSIGDALAAANGFTTKGTLNGALHPIGQGPVTQTPVAKAILAAALNPAVNATPDSTFLVTDFVKTGLDAFQTSSSTASNAYNTASSFNSSSSNDNNSFATTSSSSSSSFGSPNNSVYTSFYNSAGSANNSTIRGTGYSASA